MNNLAVLTTEQIEALLLIQQNFGDLHDCLYKLYENYSVDKVEDFLLDMGLNSPMSEPFDSIMLKIANFNEHLTEILNHLTIQSFVKTIDIEKFSLKPEYNKEQ